MEKLKIVIDNKIPFIKGIFEAQARVDYLNPAEIDKSAVAQADALIIRTRTKCDAPLLDGSRVRMIATATIGYDHINAEYCRTHNIKWENAPGCNAASVGQYVICSLVLWAIKNGTTLKDKTLGLVGVGNVGKQVEEICRKAGLKILRYDPPRADKEGKSEFVDLSDIAKQADFISFHTPLTKNGDYPTYHLAQNQFFESLKKHPVIINAARGGVIDESALLKAHKEGKIGDMIIDCWENEPQISAELLEKALIATPHIAGYSADGKSNATRMACQNIADFFNMEIDLCGIKAPALSNAIITVDDRNACTTEQKEKLVGDILLATYDPRQDTKRLRAVPTEFEKQRGDYPLRREYQAFTVKGLSKPDIIQTCRDMGFNVIEAPHQ